MTLDPNPGFINLKLALNRTSAKTSQLGLPGKPTQTYGALSPPYTEKPRLVKQSLRMRAFSL